MNTHKIHKDASKQDDWVVDISFVWLKLQLLIRCIGLHCSVAVECADIGWAVLHYRVLISCISLH